MTTIECKVLILVRLHPRRPCAEIARFGRMDREQCYRALYALNLKGFVERVPYLSTKYDVTLTGSEKADSAIRGLARRLIRFIKHSNPDGRYPESVTDRIDLLAEIDRLNGELARERESQTLVEQYLHDPEQRTMFANERMVHDREEAIAELASRTQDVANLREKIEAAKAVLAGDTGYGGYRVREALRILG